jgi:hypothetical protein
MDRASLVRRRQQIREKENVATATNAQLGGTKAAVAKKKVVMRKGTTRSTSSEDSQSEATSVSGRRELASAVDDAPPPAPPREKRAGRSAKPSKPSQPTYSAEASAGLAVRQLLQRSQFGDVKAYLQSITKPELFQQALAVATHVQERVFHREA